jgi:hypothetical protein
MKRLMAALFCLFIPVGVALADGPGPQRKMTDKEASVFSSVRSTIQDALPKAPEGYDFTLRYRSDYDEGMIPEGISPNEMFQVSYLASYIRDESLIQGETTSYFLDRTKGTPEQQARMAELNVKDAELSKARKNAKDPAEKDRIRAERKAVSAETDKLLEEIVAGYQAWLASGGTGTAAQDIKKALPAKELTVWVRLNQDVSLSDKAVPCAIGGDFPGFEQTEECQSYDSYCITVFIGPFEKAKKISGYTSYQLPETGLSVPTEVLGMALIFTGPKDKPEIVRDFVRGTDLASLRGLLP